jgi:hypothetical protein
LEKASISHIREVNEERLRFYTNITHELEDSFDSDSGTYRRPIRMMNHCGRRQKKNTAVAHIKCKQFA